MRALAVILARSGSKGLPGKNTMPIAGMPCIAWTIRAAKRATTVGEVAVTTDCEEAKRIAAEEGCRVIDRPLELAGDGATVDAAVRHAVTVMAAEKERVDPIVILYANVPVRPDDLIDRAVTRLVETGCDSVQSYAEVGKHHPWWIVRVDGAGRVSPWEGELLYHGVHRRQDLPPAFVPDGGVIAVKRRALMLEIPGVRDGPHAFLGSDRRGIVTHAGDVIDIDSAIDAAVADAHLCQVARQPETRASSIRGEHPQRPTAP